MSSYTQPSTAQFGAAGSETGRDEWLCTRDLLRRPFRGGWGRWIAFIGILIAVGASLYHIYIPFVGAYETFVLRPLHLMLIGLVGLIFFDFRGQRRDFLAPDWSWAIDAVIALALIAASLICLVT